MEGTGVVIELRGVVKPFGSVRALRGATFSVPQGEIFGFLGPNGAGKTTAIRILTAFIRADHGAVDVLGRDAWRDPVELKRRVGFLPDLLSIYGGMSGREFLDYIARLRGERYPALQRHVVDRLELSDEALSRKVRGYSQGMRKKLGLIQAMQHDPELLILDEPTEGLDPLMRQAFFSLLRELRDRGRTVFMSSHILSDVEEVCERVAIIRDGRIISSGMVSEMRQGRTRTMVVEFRHVPTDGFIVPGATVVSREGPLWRLAVTGEINDVVRVLARYDLADLTYERLSLDEIFMEFYHVGEASDA